jgi:hypothetical protein
MSLRVQGAAAWECEEALQLGFKVQNQCSAYQGKVLNHTLGGFMSNSFAG